MNLRHDNLDVFEPVFVSASELRERFFLTSNDIRKFTDLGLMEVSERQTSNGHVAKYYKSLLPGPIDLSLLPAREGLPLTIVTSKMRSFLNFVTLTPDSPSTIYFDSFLKYFHQRPDLFFSVDNFSGRVHTPVTNFKSELRENILLEGEVTASLDVATMQPLLLAKILNHKIGENEFSKWINEGLDIYEVLQDKAGSSSRSDAKKLFFLILFSKPSNELSRLFGNADWINWINNYKSIPIKENPTSTDKIHNNLAWSLQSKEVEVMTKVWESLIKVNIPFLSVHDEIIVKQKDLIQAEKIFAEVLGHEFTYFKLNRKSTTIEIAPAISVQSEPNEVQIKTLQNNIPIPELPIVSSFIAADIDPVYELVKQNPSFGILVNKLGIIADPNPTTNNKWQNDTPATIKAIRLEIKPETAYHKDEIKSLIKKHHSALNINFENIIQQLIANSVIVQNVLNHEYYYKHGSTPF